LFPQIPTRTWKLAGVGLAALACAVVVWLAVRSPSQAQVPAAGTQQERTEAVARIAARHEPRAVEALATAATKDPSPAVRRTAMAAMTPHADAEHRQVFVQGIRDTDASVRTIAAENLGSYADKPSVDELIPLVHDDPDNQVRAAALRGLAECDDPRAIVVLLQTGESGRTPELKLEGMKCLLRKFHGKLSAGRVPQDEPVWRDLIQRYKMVLPVQRAFAAAGVPLDSRPGDLLTPKLHDRAPVPVAPAPVAPASKKPK
jgi:uncharacterized membrane protein